jgi:hypothetical protein
LRLDTLLAGEQVFWWALIHLRVGEILVHLATLLGGGQDFG